MKKIEIVIIAIMEKTWSYDEKKVIVEKKDFANIILDKDGARKNILVTLPKEYNLKKVLVSIYEKVFRKNYCEVLNQLVERSIDNYKEFESYETKDNIEELVMYWLEKNIFYRIEKYSMTNETILMDNIGEYWFNTIEGSFKSFPQNILRLWSTQSISFNEVVEHSKVLCDIKNDAVEECIEEVLVKIPAFELLKIIFQLIPSFYETNVEQLQSFIKKEDIGVKILPDGVNVSVLYPKKYIDICGDSNGDYKDLVCNGVVKNLLGKGDYIIFGNYMTLETQVFNVNVEIKVDLKKGKNKQHIMKWDGTRSQIFVDIVNGEIYGEIFAISEGKTRYRKIKMLVWQFFDNIVECEESKNLFGNKLCDIILLI